MNLFKKLSPIFSQSFRILKLIDAQPTKSKELQNEHPENLICL